MNSSDKQEQERSLVSRFNYWDSYYQNDEPHVNDYRYEELHKELETQLLNDLNKISDNNYADEDLYEIKNKYYDYEASERARSDVFKKNHSSK
ncbi:hypothetical protein ACNAN0_03825 [Agrilactobacillus fermenti]|uniref:hypothetical protein n=1 Tax=Agrilactobacillus fermenti TaxID=2586909 RepID=UPI003A5C719B